MHLFTQPTPEKPCNNFLFSINDNHYVNALNVIIYLLSVILIMLQKLKLYPC